MPDLTQRTGKRGQIMADIPEKTDAPVEVKKSRLDRMLDSIERAGNKLPDPITLFLYLAIIVVLVSWLCSALHVSVINPANNEAVTPVNLF